MRVTAPAFCSHSVGTIPARCPYVLGFAVRTNSGEFSFRNIHPQLWLMRSLMPGRTRADVYGQLGTVLPRVTSRESSVAQLGFLRSGYWFCQCKELQDIPRHVPVMASHSRRSDVGRVISLLRSLVCSNWTRRDQTSKWWRPRRTVPSSRGNGTAHVVSGART